MAVRDWMSPDPVAIAPSTTVEEVRGLFHYYGIRHLPVVERDRVVGIVSDRDVRVDPAAPPDPVAAGRAVAEVMSSPAQVITADAGIDDAARLMLSRRISALPVLDDAGGLIGMVTTTDCLLASLAPRPEPAG